MENQINDAKKKLPKWVYVILLVGGVILMIIGFMQIFNGTESNAFLNKFNELNDLVIPVKNNLADISGLLSGVGTKEKARDYTGIVTDLQNALTKLNDANSSIASLASLTLKLKDLIDSTSDQNIKTTGLVFVDLSNSRDTAILKMNSQANKLINLFLPYYEGLVQGKNVKLDNSKITNASNQLIADSQLIAKIYAELDSATQDFAKAAGFKLIKK